MENTAGKIFTELKEDISTYARLKLRLLKLMAIERTAIVLAVLSPSLILLLLSFFIGSVSVCRLRVLSGGIIG